MSATIRPFPDPETMLMYVLIPINPSTWRFVTSLPAGDSSDIVVRLKRSGGVNRNIGIDRPVIDIDVFGPKSQVGTVSAAARTIQSQILSLASAVVSNGVIQHAFTVVGPRQLPEVNQNYVRFNATYELQTHA
jgi:hypothetical protein